jgi:hypothetical protein
MTPDELDERIAIQREVWREHAAQQQSAMGRLVDNYGTVEWPMDWPFFILDRAHRLTIGVSRLESHYVTRQIDEIRELLNSLERHVTEDEFDEWN